jgi:hypothetical protein
VTSLLRTGLAALLLSAATSAAHAEPQLEVMPSVGLGKATGDGADEMDLGPALLLSIGARMHPNASLGGQLIIDKPGIDGDVPPGVDVSFWMFRGQIVPAFHVANEKVDFAFGPSLGLVYMRLGVEGNTGFGDVESTLTARGFTLGVQAWLMARVTPQLSLGPVFSYGRLWFTKVCAKSSGEPEECDNDPDNDDAGYWNLSFGLLF